MWFVVRMTMSVVVTLSELPDIRFRGYPGIIEPESIVMVSRSHFVVMATGCLSHLTLASSIQECKKRLNNIDWV